MKEVLIKVSMVRRSRFVIFFPSRKVVFQTHRQVALRDVYQSKAF